MIEREFYRLPELAQRWGCTVHDLLHLGIQDRAQICATIYGMASVSSSRTCIENEGPWPALSEAKNAAFERWKSRTTKDMPPGVYVLVGIDLREMEVPDALPYALDGGMHFDGDSGWWVYTFDSPVTIKLDHLCMLHEEMQRLDREVFGAGARASDAQSASAAPHPQAATADVQTPQQGRRMKKAAMVKELERVWPTIEADLREASRSTNQDLKAANVGHGMWDVDAALRWADSRGKTKKRATQSSVPLLFGGLVRD